MDPNQQTQQLLLNPLPLNPNQPYPYSGISQQIHQPGQQKPAYAGEKMISNTQELHKISEGVFSSEQSCNSPLDSQLKPNYSQRPVTQSKSRIQPKAQQHSRRMILLENGEVDHAAGENVQIQNQGVKEQHADQYDQNNYQAVSFEQMCQR